MEFALQPRESITINLANFRQVKQLKKFGHLTYVSKSMKYAILYANKSQALKVCAEISKLSSVRRAEISPRASLKANFDEEQAAEFKRTSED
ncbi:YlbG family protein [Pediococcus cellicola]|uniref:DUF2129 domain-containing protein n=1 Tax=Pediococcus cellicola TaxID=319652 RepID=A0A0R2IQZ0_9LACO|nr:YlbG family protein [Pediococcus cellicola]KRN67467.1 hypothetical protein IV80_GL000005 [Pediococcus cellicola]GEL14549.1 UPF0298 protein [Pediococcus cellicola]